MPHPQSTLERADTTLHGPQRPIHGTVTAHMTSAARGGHTQTRHATQERPIGRLSAARAPHTRLGGRRPTRVRPDSSGRSSRAAHTAQQPAHTSRLGRGLARPRGAAAVARALRGPQEMANKRPPPPACAPRLDTATQGGCESAVGGQNEG